MLHILKPWNLRIYPLTEAEEASERFPQPKPFELTEDMLLPDQVEHHIEQLRKRSPPRR